MRHWYVVFAGDVSSTAAHVMLKRWGARVASDQPAVPLSGGDLALSVEGPDDLQERVKDLPDVAVYDNQTHQDLY